MTDSRAAFHRGAAAGALLAVGALAIYWFISGGPADATTFRELAVWGQALLGFGGAALLWLKQRRLEREKTAAR